MSDLKQYDIRFAGLKLGEHEFDYQLSDSFFELFDYRDYQNWQVKANVKLLKKSNSLELSFSVKGEVEVHCDLTDEPFQQPIDNKAGLLVKFGSEYNDTNEEILILPEGEHQFSVAQYLYELSVLAIPLKRVHPDVESGKLGGKILEKLQSLSPDNQLSKEEEKTDPRWDKLRSLLK